MARLDLILSKLLLSIKGQPLLKKSFCHSMKQIQLYDYQTEMKQRIESVFKLHRSAMVQMPTGTGKTLSVGRICVRLGEKEMRV